MYRWTDRTAAQQCKQYFRKRKKICGFIRKKRYSSSALCGFWQRSQCSRMRCRSHPLPSSAGHINPAGLCLYGSPAHTSVMRVNKQRAKGQLSPQNKRERRGGKKEVGGKGERPEAVLRSLSGLQAGSDIRDNSSGPEMIINREQGRVYEGKGLHCLYLSNLLLPRIW